MIFSVRSIHRIFIGYLKNVLIAKSNDKLSLSGVDIILNNKIMEEKLLFYISIVFYSIVLILRSGSDRP